MEQCVNGFCQWWIPCSNKEVLLVLLRLGHKHADLPIQTPSGNLQAHRLS